MYYIELNNKILAYSLNKEEVANLLSHIPNKEETKIKETPDGYTIKDYELVSMEEFNKQKLQEEQEQRIAAIKQELIEIDAKTMRPLRAGEQDKLDELEAQAETLRQEMKDLELEETQEFEEIGGLSLED